MGAVFCLQTKAGSSYAATVRFGSVEVRMKLRYNPRCTLSSSNDHRSLHVWGAIAYDGTICLIKAPEKAIRCTIYIIYKNREFSFYPELGFNLVDDNAPTHVSHAVNEWKIRNGIQSVPWPACSPDLIPIQNVSAFMKTQLGSMKLEFPDLQGAVCNWNKMVSKLYESIPKLIEKCIFNTDFLVNYWCHGCVRFFSFRYIAYESTLDERRLLIR